MHIAEGTAMSVKAAMALALILASFVALMGCGEERTSSTGGQAKERTTIESMAEQETNTLARAGNAEAAAGDDGSGVVAQAGNAGARVGAVPARRESGKGMARSVAGEDHPQQVTLKVSGSPGSRFSGKCAVGDEGKAIGGRVPERYNYAPGDEKLDCEIRKGSQAGVLQIVLTAGDNIRSVQRIDARGGITQLTYSAGGSISSSTSSDSTSQTMTSSILSSSASLP